MKNHVFVNHCVDFDELLNPNNWVKGKTVDRFLVALDKQSKTEEAKIRVDFANYQDYTDNESCPAYFGMGVEWLAWHFINHYGRNFNIEGLQMTDSEGSSEEDYGVDGVGRTIIDSKNKYRTTNRRAVQGSEVFLQVKGTLNRLKEYTPNDGSRLPNFGMNAMATAITTNKALQARYIVFTTGKGLHFSMEKMCRGLIEVISYADIKAHMDQDFVFLNRLRASVGLAEIPLEFSKGDAEGLIQFEGLEDDA
jgi:hypothetical protein